MLLRRAFSFDAAHRLTRYQGKCENLHGHTYRFVITLRGNSDDEGMVFDFVELKRLVCEQILSRLDHSYLNDILEQPSAENIARWIFERADGFLARPNCALESVEVWETADCSAIFERKDLPV